MQRLSFCLIGATILFAAGCSAMDMKPIYRGDDPSILIASHDITRVKAAIVEQAAKEHFNVDVDASAGAYVQVSRRLSFLKVLLLAENIAGKNDREILCFHIEPAGEGVRVSAYRIEQMELPGGGVNRDPLMDMDTYVMLKNLLENAKRRVERHGLIFRGGPYPNAVPL